MRNHETHRYWYESGAIGADDESWRKWIEKTAVKIVVKKPSTAQAAFDHYTKQAELASETGDTARAEALLFKAGAYLCALDAPQ